MGLKIITCTFDDYGIKDPSWVMVVNESEVESILSQLQVADRWEPASWRGQTHRFEVRDPDSLEFVIKEINDFHAETEEG